MNFFGRALAAMLFLSTFIVSVRAQTTEPSPRHITFQEAVQLAVKHNHVVRMAGFEVQEKQQAKEAARSGYLPTVTNDSRIFTVTDSQFIQIAAGSLGTVAGTPIPERSATLNQGGRTFVISGTGLSQPLTQLFTRVKPSNEVARADLDASRANERQTVNEIALRVHQIYYQLLVTQLHPERHESEDPGRSGAGERARPAGEIWQHAG